MVTLTQHTLDNTNCLVKRLYKAHFSAFFLHNVIQNTKSQVYTNWNPNPQAYPALPPVVKYLSHSEDHHHYVVCERSSEASPPHSAIKCFLSQFPVPHFHTIQYLLTSSSSSSHSFYLSFNSVFRNSYYARWDQSRLASRLFIVCRILLSCLNMCNTSSFLARSVQIISILLQHHISNLSREF